jgi:outer membrane protein assembly factor BamD (BamD/ComL family)
LADGRSAHEHIGFLPPDEFLAELELGVAKVFLKRREYGTAAEWLTRIRDQRPTSHVAAEAAYWVAVALYNESGQKDGLLKNWRTLRLRYPDSVWRWKQMIYE